MQIGIVAQKGNDRATRLAADLHEELAATGLSVRVDTSTAAAIGVDGIDPAALAECALIVSIGGDGTFLYTARHVGSTPILGVNLGEVGFLNAVPPDEAAERVLDEVEHIRETGDPRSREVPRLAVCGDDWSLPSAMNEVVVQGPQRGHGNGADIEVRVDGSTYITGHADGVLVATPTGSTAYNLSEGGPLMHSDVEGFVITEMCATDPMPPLLVALDSEITVRATDAAYAVVASDGGNQRCVETPAHIDISLADDPGRIAGPRADFFEALDKLD